MNYRERERELLREGAATISSERRVERFRKPGGGVSARRIGFIEPEFDGAASGWLCGKGAEKGQLWVTIEREVG